MKKQTTSECDASLTNSFQDDGVDGPIPVLSQQEAKKAYAEFDKWKESLPNQQVLADLRFKPHLYLPFVNRIAHHPQLVIAVQQALDTDNILLWSSDF